jgi:Spy/CpxP family protein refolding chaperone
MATGGSTKTSMNNKIFAIALGGMLALSANAALYAQDQTQTQAPQEQGQGHRGMHMDPNRQLEHLTKTLNLSADQQTQIKPILTDRQQKMQALFQDQSMTREDRHSKAQAIQQDTKTRLEAALNDQQKQQFEEMQAKMRAHRHQGGDNQAPPSGAVQPQ